MKPSILVISSFPPKGQVHNKKIVGVASYTKNLLLNIDKKVIVFAEKLHGEKDYKEGTIEVKRIWKRNSFFAFVSILNSIRRHKECSTILFEFEHSMFGGTSSLIPLPFFLFVVKRLLGKEVFFVFHQVIGDINSLSGHLNFRKNSLKTKILNLIIPIFYKTVLFNITKAIVFEEELKVRLGNSAKIEVIPHGVEDFKTRLTAGQAKRQLGLSQNKFVILCFGFLAWYKGSDLIVDKFHALPKDIREKSMLILAGGPNPNHTDKAYYDRYVKSIKSKAGKQVLVTDFVPQEEIGRYFVASDVVIFPYRTFMSSSGPLSMALSFEKPFLISSDLKDIIKTADFRESLKEANLSESDIIFNGDLVKKLKALQGGNLRQNLVKFTKILKKERNLKSIAQSYEKILYQGKKLGRVSLSASLDQSLV